MTYTSLTAAKGTPSALASWVNYTKLDVGTIVDEAQALLYGEAHLRCREMLSSTVFTVPAGNSYIALPSGFLDPIGRVQLVSVNSWAIHKDSNFVQEARQYTENSGSLGADPFTTALNSATVSVNLPSHNLTQDSVFSTAGAVAFNGVTIAGTFPINGITDANNFTIDISGLGTLPSAAGTGGGSSVTYIADQLTTGSAAYFGIWDELLRFDVAFDQTSLCRMQFYKSLPLLSSTNLTNFLTNRYPQVMRVACMAAAADFMKDDTEYQKQFTRLSAMTQAISVENDMQYRGMEHMTDTP